ncbi:MAG: zinc-binding alcohol dehydrogenase family protein [Roseiarcus sp.]|jgi:2-desacetyl-2-hydroxyethyl bacteriochlorophyllide A dehydrogenase
MRALLCGAPGALSIVERPIPEPGPGEARVRLRRAGVCGTDLHIFEGTQPYFAYPRIIGHELAGEIDAVGPASRLAPGGRVAIIPYLACGFCVACRRGRTNCCQRLEVLGVHVDGGMADYVCVPEANLMPADDLGLDEAAMAEFLAIGAHAVRRGGVGAGDRVLVTGAGPIGIACMIFARLAGAVVTALDTRADRLDFCRREIGADHAARADADARSALSDVTSGDFFDCVFDATGNAAAMNAGFDYVAHGGSYVLVGIVRDTIAFADPEFHKRETTLLGSRNATREDFEAVFAALRGGRVPARALATHRARLDDAPALFPVWITPAAGVIKAIIEI